MIGMFSQLCFETSGVIFFFTFFFIVDKAMEGAKKAYLVCFRAAAAFLIPPLMQYLISI